MAINTEEGQEGNVSANQNEIPKVTAKENAILRNTPKEDNQGELGQTSETDLFSALIESGYQPQQILESVPKNHVLVVDPKEVYQEKYADKFESEEDFNDFYEYAGELKNMYNNNVDMFGNYRVTGSETFGYGRGHDKFGKSGNVRFEDADPIYQSFINARTGEFESRYSPSEQASFRGFYFDERTGKKVNRSLTMEDRFTNRFALKYDEERKPYWALMEDDAELYKYEQAHIWGDQEKYGTSLMDGIYGFLSEVGPGLAQTPAQLGIIGMDIAGWAFNFENDSDTYKSLTKMVNILESVKYKPSQEVEQGDVFAFGASTFYNFGKGLAYLVPQRLGASLASSIVKKVVKTPRLYKGVFRRSADALLGPQTARKFIKPSTKSVQEVVTRNTALAIGVMQPAPQIYRSARQAGLEPADAAAMSILAMVPTYLTERALSVPWITRGLAKPVEKVWNTEMSKAFVDYQKSGMMNTLKTEAGKIKFLAKLYTKFNKSVDKLKVAGGQTWKSLPGALKVPKGIAEGMAREGAQEYSEEFLQAATEIIYDNTIGKGKEVGEGHYGTSWKDVREQALEGGFLGALVGGFTGAFINGDQDQNNDREHTMLKMIGDSAIKDGDDGARKTYETLVNRIVEAYENGEFSNQFLTPDGEALNTSLPENGFQSEIELPGVKDNYVRSMADLTYYSALSQAHEAFKLYQEAGFNDPDLIATIGESDEFMVETMKNVKEQKAVRARIQEIENTLSSLKEGDDGYQAATKELEIANKELEALTNDYNELTVPEEGTKFSKRVNDRIKQVRVRSQAARDITDKHFQDRENVVVDNEFRQSDDYKSQYQKNIAIMYDHYKTSKNIDSAFNQYLENVKKINEDKKAAREQVIEGLDNIVQDFSERKITDDNIISEVEQMNAMLTDIASSEIDFNLQEEIKANFTQAIEDVQKRINSTYSKAADRLGLEDPKFNEIETTVSKFRAQKNILNKKLEAPLSKENYSIGENVSIEVDGQRFEGTIQGVQDGSDIKKLDEIQYKIKTNDGQELYRNKDQILKSDNLEVNEEQEFRKFLIDNLYQQLSVLQILINDNNGAGQSVESLQQMVDKLQNDIEFFETGTVAKNILHKDEYSQPHLLQGERTIDNKTYSELQSGYQELKIALKKLDDDLQKLTGASSTFSFRAKQAHVRASGFTLSSMLENGYQDVFDKLNISDSIKNLNEITILDPDIVEVSEEQRQELQKQEKALNYIMDIIYRNRDEVFAKNNIKNFLNKTFLVDKPRMFYQQMEESTGAVKYNIEDLAYIRNKESYSDSTYYLSTINLLMRMHGLNVNEFQQARYELLSDVSKNVSSYEQQIAEHQVVSFLNVGTELLDMIVEIETEYNKKKMNSKEIQQMTGHYIQDSIMIQGWYGTGKTFQVLPNALKIYNQITGNEIKVGIAGISQKIIDNVKNDLTKTHDINGLDFNEIDASLLLEGKANLTETDLIIFDEASFLSKSDIYALKKQLKDSDAKIIFLGDESQMIPVDSGETVRWASQTGIKTTPLTNIFRNDNPLIQGLAKWMIDGNTRANRTDLLSKDDPIPEFWHEQDDSGNRFGTHYFKQNVGKYNKPIVKEFISRPDNVDKVLIVVDQEQYNAIVDDFPDITNLKDKIKTLDWVHTSTEPGCVQGLGFNEVYIPIDFQHWKNNSTRIKQQKLAWAAGYTAISRAKNYVALPGPVNNQFKSRPVFFKTKEKLRTGNQIEQEQSIREQRIFEEKQNIENTIIDDTFDVTKTSEPKKGDNPVGNKKNSIVRNKKVTTKPSGETTTKEVISDNAYNTFQEEGYIPWEIMDSIAGKIKKQQPLSPREQEMAEKGSFDYSFNEDSEESPLSIKDENPNKKIEEQQDKLEGKNVEPQKSNNIYEPLPRAKRGLKRIYEITEGDYAGNYIVLSGNYSTTDAQVRGKIYKKPDGIVQVIQSKDGKGIKSGATINRDSISPIQEENRQAFIPLKKEQKNVNIGDVYIDNETGKPIVPTNIGTRGKEFVVEVNNHLIPLDKFNSRYEQTEDPGTFEEQEKNISRFKASHEVMKRRNNVSVWGSTYTFVPELAPEGTDIQYEAMKKQVISPYLLSVANIGKSLVYMKSANLINAENQGNNLLFVKLNPNKYQMNSIITKLNDIKNPSPVLKGAIDDILKVKKIPEHYAYFMALADTEVSYMINNEKQVITNYDKSLTDINSDIERGFSQTSSINPEIDQSNIELNKALAALRKEGYERSKNEGNIVVLGDITNITDKNHGQAIYGPDRFALKTFKDNIQKDPLKGEIVFSHELYQGATKDGRVKVKMYYAYGENPNAQSPYIIFNTPFVSENFGSGDTQFDAKLRLENDKKNISNSKWLSNYDNIHHFNAKTSELFVMQLLFNNKSFINKNPKIFNQLKNYFSFKNGYPNIDKNSNIGKLIKAYYDAQNKKIKGIGLEKEILTMFIDHFNSALNGTEINMSKYSNTKGYNEYTKHLKTFRNVISEAKTSLHMPIEIQRGRKSSLGRPVVPSDLLYTNAIDIHLPYAYTDISGVLKEISSEANNNMETQNDQDFISGIMNSGMPKFNIKKTIASLSSRRIEQEQAEMIIRNILGEDFLNNKTEFKTNLRYNTQELFGMMKNGKIILELNNKGIESTTPRHEIFHVVFNYMLDNQTKSKLISEVRSNLNKPNMSDVKAEEYMARKYGRQSQEGLASKYSVKGIVQRFFRFLNNVYDKFVGNFNLLDELLSNIESGTYRNAPIINDSLNIERHHDPDPENEMDDSETIPEDSTIDDIQNRDTDALVDYVTMPSIFGDYSGFVRKEIAFMFNEMSYFNPNPNIVHTSIPDAYHRIYHAIRRNGQNLGTELSSLGKPVSQITKEDVNNRMLNAQDWANYKQFQLSDRKVFDAFVKNIFPNLKLDSLKTIKHTTATHYGDELFNPGTITGDHFKFQLELTPLRQFKNGKLMNWDNQTFVSMNEMNKIMSLSREQANKRYYKDTTQSYEKIFVEEVQNLANKAGEDTYRSNHAHSFLAKFSGVGYATENPNEVQMSMRELINFLSEDDISSNRDRILTIHKMLNHINNMNKSLYMKNVAMVEYNRGKLEYFIPDNSSYARVKQEIMSNMKQRMFSETLLSARKKAQIDPNSKNNLFTVEKDGLYWTKGDANIKLISVDSSGVFLTPDFDISYMNSIKSFFGLNTIKDRVFFGLMSNYEGVTQVINDTSRKDIQFKTDQVGPEYLARGLMGMFYATKVNVDMTEAISELQKTYPPDDPNFKKYEQEVIAGTRSRSPLHDRMNNMYKGLGVTEENIDNLFESFQDENDEVSGNYQMPKPFDVYPFINTISELEVYFRGSEEMNFFYRPDGTKEYLHQLHSHMTKTFHYGSENIIADFNRVLEENKIAIIKDQYDKLIPEEQVNYVEEDGIFVNNLMRNSAYLDENGNPLYRILDDKNPMAINTIRDFSGMKAIRGTTKPNMTDVTTMLMTAFIDSVKKTSVSTSRLQRLNMSMNNISDKEKLFVAEVEFDATGNSRLFTAELDDAKNIKNIILHYDVIFDGIKNKFKQLQRLQHTSRNSWDNFLMNLRKDKRFGKQTFAPLFAKNMKKAWEMNDVDSLNKVNRVFENSFKSLNDETKKAFIEEMQKSNLIENRDYIITKDSVLLGNAINVNKSDTNETVYTLGNMYDILNLNSNDINAEKYLDKIFDKNFNTNEYRKYRNKLYETRYTVPEDIAALLPGSSPIYDSNTGKFNPFFKAHFFANEIFQNEITPFLNGFEADYKDSTERSKRTGATTTGAYYMQTGIPYGLNPKGKAIIINDHYIDSLDFANEKGEMNKIAVADGQMIGNPLFKSLQMVSVGDVENAPIGNGMQKTLSNQIDFTSGKLTQIKHANLPITSDIYAKNSLYRLMMYDMLRTNTIGAQKDIQKRRDLEKIKLDESLWEDFDLETNELKNFDLNDLFEEFYEETNSIEEASDKLRNWIEEVSDVADDIKNNIVWGMQYKTGSKVANNHINNYDLQSRETLDSNFATIDIQNDKIGVVLNPSQDIERYKNITPMNQILSFIGYGSDENSKQAMRTYDAFKRIYDLEDQKVKNDIEQDFDGFIRKQGLLSLRESGFVGTLSDALNDPKISIQIPSFRSKLVQIFRNYLTNRMIRQKMFGIRVNQASGFGFLMFEQDGVVYTMDQVEKDNNVKFNPIEMAKMSETGGAWKGYTIRRLNSMRLEGGEMKPAEVGVSYSYFKNFDLLPGENVSDALTVTLQNGEHYVIDPDMTREEIREAIEEDAELIDIDKTISARKYAKSLGQVKEVTENKKAGQLQQQLQEKLSAKEEPEINQDLVTAMTNYFESFVKTLNMYVARVPSSRLGSGAIVRPTFFVQDSANVMFIPPELTELNDSDFDIDQLSLYQFSIDKNGQTTNVTVDSDIASMDTYEEIQDFVLDNIISIYKNKANAQDILVSSNIDKQRNVAGDVKNISQEDIQQLTEEEQRYLKNVPSYKRMNSFSTMLNDYEVNSSGARSIGILARSMSALSYLSQIRTNEFQQLAPGFAKMNEYMDVRGDESMIVRLGNYLQSALDNAKELILGNMGITTYATPLIAPMIMENWSDVKIRAFFSNPAIRNVLNKLEQGDSVMNKKSDFQLHDIIDYEKKMIVPLSNEEKLNIRKELKDLRENDPQSMRVNELEGQLNRHESLKYLNKLQELATKGESLRRFGDFIATRNGLKVHDFDFERNINSFEQYLGMSLEEYFNPNEESGQGVWSLEKHMDFYRAHNNDFFAAIRNDSSKIAGAHMDENGVVDYSEMQTSTKNGKDVFKRIINNQQYLSLDENRNQYYDSRNQRYYKRLSDWLGLGIDTENELLTSAKNIGNAYDTVMRDFFRSRRPSDRNYADSFKRKYDNYNGFATQKVFDDYIQDLEKFAKWLDGRNETPYASVPDSGDTPKGIILHFPDLGVAGEIDMLTINDSGDISIYDLKSLRKGTKEEADSDYETSYEQKPSKKDKHAMQVNGYRALLRYNYGYNVKNMYIIPVGVNYEAGDSNSTYSKMLPFRKVDKMQWNKLKKTMRIKELKPMDKALEKGENLQDVLLRREKAVAEQLNIAELLKKFGHFHSYTKLYHEENVRTKNQWTYDHNSLNEIAEQYLNSLDQINWDFKNRRTAFYNNVSKAVLGLHFSTHKNYEGKTFDINIPIEERTGDYVSLNNTLSNVSLNIASGRTLFKKQFPAYIGFVKEIISEHGIRSTKIFKDAGMNLIADNVHNLIDNSFFERIQNYPQNNRDVLILRESINLNEHEIQRLKYGFNQLPIELQEMFAVNDFLNYTFQYRNGTISDVIGLKFYKEVSDTMTKFKNVLDGTEGTDYLRKMGSGIISSTQHSKNGTPFYSKKVHIVRGEIRPDLVLKKVKVRDGLYVYKHLRYDPIADKYYDENAEYKIGDEIEMNKDIITHPDFQYVTTTPTIKIFTAEELSELQAGNFVDHSFRKGHNYTEDERYITETGEIIRVHNVSDDYMEVTFKSVNSNAFYNKKAEEKIRNESRINEEERNFSLDNAKTIEKFYEGKRLEKSAIDNIVDRLSRISNASFIQETNESIKRKFGNINARAWVDSDGIHYNLDKVRSTDFMHELSHLWFKGIKKHDPLLWNDLVDQAVNMIENNHAIVLAVKNKFKNNNLTLNKSTLIDEVIANVAGLASENAVDSFLSGNNITQSTEKGFIQNIWQGLKNLANRISQFFTRIVNNDPNYTFDKEFKEDTLENITMADMFKIMAQNVFTGQVSSEFSTVLIKGYNLYKNGTTETQKNNIQNAKARLRNYLGDDYTHEDYDIVKEAVMNAQANNDVSIAIETVFDNNGDVVYYARVIENDLNFSLENEDFIVTNDISEAMPLFNNNSTPQESLAKVQDSRLASGIVNQMMKNGTQGKNKDKPVYVYNLAGKEYEYSKTMDYDQLKVSVETDIIPQFNLFEKDLKPKLQLFSQKLKTETDRTIGEIGNEVFGKSKFSESTLNQIIKLLNLNQGFENVYRYSDLANETDVELRKLYSSSFTGFDPIVVIHNRDNNGNVDMSIVDITSKPIIKNNKDLSQKGLQSTKEYDFDYTYRGGKLENHDRDIRKLLLGMTALSMSKNSRVGESKKPKIRIRNLGVAQLMGNNLRKHMVYDLNQIVHEVRLVKNNEKYMRNINNDEILNVLEDESVYDNPMQQSYMGRLTVYLQHQIDSEGISYAKREVFKEQLGILNDPEATKSDLINIIENRKAYIEGRMEINEAWSNEEYQMLSETLRELQTGYVGRINDIRNMREYEMLLNTAHDLSDDVLQWLVNSVALTKNIVVEEMTKEQKYMRDDFRKMINIYEESHSGSSLTKYYREIGSKYFQHLFKKTTANHKGQDVEVILPELHWDKNDKDTAKLLKDGLITETDLEFTNKLLDKIEERWIKNQLHNRRKADAKKQVTGKSQLTIDDIKSEFLNNENYTRGTIPMVTKSVNELLFSGKLKDATSRMGNILGNFEVLFEDDDLGSSVSNVSNSFNGQFNIKDRYSKIGLDYESTLDGDKQITVTDFDANMNASTNLEVMYNYFMLSGIRQEHYENRVLPVYNSAKSILMMYKDSVSSEEKAEYMRYNIKWADEYINRVVHRKSGETSNKITLPKIKGERKFDKKGNPILPNASLPNQIEFNRTARALVGATSFVTLGYSSGVAFKSLMFNEIALFTNSLAASISGANKSNAALPGIKDIHFAQKVVLGAGQKYDFKKARRIALDLQLINRTERDVLESPFINLTNKNVMQKAHAHLLNWGTDAAARMISMVAIMKKDGTWDAYTYDEKTGDAIYDEKEDRRFYDENGKAKTSKGEHAIRNKIREELIYQGLQSEDESKLTRAYDFNIVDGTMKWYADKYIIGTMDEVSKPIIGNRFVGAALSNFRVFSFSRIFNAGVYGESRKTSRGSSYKAVQDEDGTWISVKDVIEMEGAYQSFNKAFNAFKNMDNKNIAEWWKSADDITKFNISKTFVQMALWGLMYGLVKGAWDKDKFSWLYTDIFIGPAVSDVVTGSPFPTWNIVSDFMNSASGGDLEGMAKTFGATRNIVKGSENIEEIFPSEDSTIDVK